MFSVFEVGSRGAEKRACAELRERFGTDRETRFARSVTYYDTFEWRLHRRGTSLSSWQNRDQPVVCWQTNDGRVLHRMVGVPLPRFASGMPAGTFRDDLFPCVEIRALLPVVEVELRATELRILDENQKTVVQALFERGYAARPGSAKSRRRLPGTLTVAAVRGYEKQAERVARFIEEKIGLAAAPTFALERALTALDLRPAAHDTKFQVALGRGLVAEDALREILSSLFRGMRINEDGLRKDLDSEFLHDFRVAGRRTRVALGQIKRVLPAERIERFSGDFKWLGALTNPTRDLDVYLLKLPAYRAMLPVELQADLAPLEELLSERQREERGRLVAGLDSDRYRSLLRDWPKFLAGRTPAAKAPAAANRPAIDVAAARIRRAYRRVLERGRQARKSQIASDLHQLRLECKKLRYLLEFFTSLFDEKRVRLLVRALKKLQDNLGDINDLQVQQGALTGYARELAEGPGPSERTLVALGRLVERLAAEQQREQRQFESRFEQFACKPNQAHVKSLFGKKGNEA